MSFRASRWLSSVLGVVFLASCFSHAQEVASLPPPCPMTGVLPGEASPPFSVLLTSGLILRVPNGASLPLVVFSVDSDKDPGGVILASDTIEIDRMLSEAPPMGTILFLSQSTPGGGAALQEIFDLRLSLLPAAQAAAWRAILGFAVLTLDALRAFGCELAGLLDSWQSPRLWVTAPPPGAIAAPRVDGFNECFVWPPAQADFQLIGPFTACAPEGLNGTSVPQGALLLVLNATAQGGDCDAEAAVSWAQAAAGPAAAGAIIAAPAPVLIGRNCTDTFYDDQFFPMVVSEAAGVQFAARLAPQTPFNVSLNYTCSTGTWIAVDSAGRLAPIGWRKFTEASALRWAIDHLNFVASAASASTSAGSQTIVLAPSNSTITAFAGNVTFPSVSDLRTAAAAGPAVLDFTLRCPGDGDNGCGPWDRVISATAQCWTAEPPPSLPAPVEIGRWITPFRRSTGRWLTNADALVGLIGNGTVENSALADAAWTCLIVVASCCETWMGSMSLVLNSSSASVQQQLPPPAPAPAPVFAADFEVVPIATVPIVFANMGQNFTPGYNANRTALLIAPVAWDAAAPHARVALIAWITGHGSNPPPPVSQGCEYAPTSHAFTIALVSDPTNVLATANSSLIAFDQYMLAGSMFGCSEKTVTGVISNQHGDYRDGRNGWCPGQAVKPLLWDVTSAFSAIAPHIPRMINYSALSYYVGGTNASADGCGGYVVFSAALLFYTAVPM